MGFIEAGQSDFFVPRGYVHVIADCRGTGGSGGPFGFFDGQERRDMHDLVEEALAWFDHWLKGHETGILDGPPIRYAGARRLMTLGAGLNRPRDQRGIPEGQPPRGGRERQPPRRAYASVPAMMGFRHATVGTSSLNTVISSSRLLLPVLPDVPGRD
jgi:hypothetical protein